MAQLVFPGVSLQDFDATADWLVAGFDEHGKSINFVGTGQNKGLSFVLSYEEHPEEYDQLFNKYLREGRELYAALKRADQPLQEKILIYERFPLELFLEESQDKIEIEWEVS